MEKRCAVLVVEDDESVQYLIATVLRKQCTSIDRAGDGEQAIALLRAKSYDVVVLDIMLPKANGFQVAEVIRSLNPRPRLIVLSAVAKYFGDRFPPNTVIMQKPFEIARLTEAVIGA